MKIGDLVIDTRAGSYIGIIVSKHYKLGQWIVYWFRWGDKQAMHESYLEVL